MFNLLILSLMDALQPERLSACAHQGHVMALGLGLGLTGVAGLGLVNASAWPSLGWIGLYSPVLIVGYLLAARMTFILDRQRLAAERREVAEALQYERLSLRGALTQYAAAAAFVVAGAVSLPVLGTRLAAETGLGEAFVGNIFIALTTSLPEIVVSVAAVRMGALDLGIGNVLGSNLFNLLVLGLDDIFYRPGPLLLAADASHLVAVLAAVVMNALFLIGLTEHVAAKRFRVAWDTGAIAIVYICAIWLMYQGRP